MNPGQVPLTIKMVVLQAVIICLSLLIVTIAFFIRSRKSGLNFTVFLLFIPLWIIVFVSGLFAEDIRLYLFLSKVEYLVMMALPFSWLIFSMDFAGINNWQKTGKVILMSAVPLLLSFLVITGQAPNLLYDHHKILGLNNPGITGPEFLVQNLFNAERILLWPDILNLVHVLYLFVFFVIGTVLIFKELIRNTDLRWEGILLFGTGLILLWIGSVTFIFRTPSFNYLDFSPVAFSSSVALMAIGSRYFFQEDLPGFSWKSVAEKFTDELLIFDKSNRIVYYNDLAAKVFRFSEKLTLGQPIDNIFHNYPELTRFLKLRSGNQIEIHLLNGSHRTYHRLNIIPLVNSRGEDIGKLAMMRDISAAREMETRLKESTGQALKADRLTRSFLANMSHEIRTPMNSIIGFSDLLGDPGLSGDQRSEYTRLIQDGSSSLLKVIESIIDISKLEAGMVPVRKGPVSIPDLLKGLLSEYSEILSKLGKMRVRLLLDDLSDDPGQKVMTDGGIIRKILSAMLDNAIKYTHEGSVQFGAEMKPGSMVQFYVKDTGTGIPKEMHSIVFQRFNHTLSGLTQDYSGLGLGLSISKGFSELLGGKVWFESEPGYGSIFYLTVPFSVVRP